MTHLSKDSLSPSAEENWHLVQLKPNGLRRAVTNLERQNIVTFMPFREVSRRSSKGQITIRQPVFPGYLFVTLTPESSGWRTVNNTFGVSRIVSFGSGAPQSLPPSLIQGLRARCDAENRLLPPDDFEAGERVRAIAGPFVEFVATIEVIPDSNRVGVLFEIMGRTVRATMSLNDIERTSE